MNKRRLLIRICTVALLLAIGAVMMVIGRGHTIYFDNKKLEYEGTEYEAVRRINVYVGDSEEPIAKLSKKERGMATFTGQDFRFRIEVIREKGGDSEWFDFDVKVPYGQDGTIVNMIGMIEGLPQEAWMEEFIPAPVVEEEEELDLDDLDDSFGIDSSMEEAEAAEAAEEEAPAEG